MARGWHYAKLSLSDAPRLSFSGLCILLFKRKIRTHLDLLSIPRLWGKNVKFVVFVYLCFSFALIGAW